MQDTTETVINRTGQLPLRFHGEKIGSGSTRTLRGDTQNRWTEVKIYRTKGGKFVASVGHYSCYDGEQDFIKAQSFESAADVIAFLRDESGNLGRASQNALVEASQNSEDFDAAYKEVVE